MNKILRFIELNPSIQYPIYLILGVKNQIKSLFLSRRIRYGGDYPFLFIVGSGRSGNTLLRKLLMERSDIYIPPESYVLGCEVITHLNAPGLCWADKVDLTLAKIEYYSEFETYGIDSLREFSIYAKKFLKGNRCIGNIIIELYRWIAKEKGLESSWVGDKSPINTLRLGLLKKLIPNSVYVYIERDGVDVACSYLNSGLYTKIDDAAYRWKNSRLAWLKFKGCLEKDNYIEIKYEDLVENPDLIISYILKKFNISTRDIILNLEDKLGDVSSRSHHKNVRMPTDKNIIGKGRAGVNEYDKIILRSIIGKELKASGYSEI